MASKQPAQPLKPKVLSIARVQNYWYRQGLIKYFFILVLLGFGFRIVSIHQLDAAEISIQERGNKQANHQSKQKAYRGDILDRHGKVLASELILKKVNLDPTQVQLEFIAKLAAALMMPEPLLQTAIKAKLSKQSGRRNLIIKKNLKLTDPILTNLKTLKKTKLRICHQKQVKQKPNLWNRALILAKIKTEVTTYKVIETCKRRKVNGVNIQTETQRYYPKFASLAPLLGRVNQNGTGVSGIEGEFDTTLAGTHGITQLSFNQKSQNAYFNPATTTTLQQGQDIKLTIDAAIQFHAYAAVKTSVETHQADSGSAIVLAPNGEILAMVNYPADDPNDKTQYNPAHYRNRVLSDKVEPGSTMKPFTMLLALDENKISATENEKIDVTKRIGHIKPDGKYQQMTVKKILQKSHNLGTVNISERLSKQSMYHTWQKLGFGQPLGLIPSIESAGSLRHFSTWSRADKRALSFGYGPMETNLAQLARAYLVFANQGTLPALKLLKDVPNQIPDQAVFSLQSTAKITTLLDAVVSNKGSGYRAQIKGYDVAGKTGTAEMVVDGAYSKKGAKRTFFTGFAPANQPKYIMAVRLDHPKKCYTSWNPNLRDKCQGSNSAAITFKNAMRSILQNDNTI